MLTDVVYDSLRDKILNLDLKPGTPLSFSALSSQYGVSISPIRDALKRLATEGLVEIKPQSGTYVSLIDLDKVRDERFMRLSLELGVIEKLESFGISDSLIDKWEEFICLQNEAFSCRNTARFLDLDDQMHMLLFKECKHEKVFNLMKSTSGNYHRIRMVSFLFDDILNNIVIQHRALLDALKKRNIQELLSLDRQHISKIEIETAAYQKAFPQYFKK